MTNVTNLLLELDRMAVEIAKDLPDSKEWGGLIVYFFEALEKKTTNKEAFNEMLGSIHDYLTAHLDQIIR
jgi:hypothetical protein